MGANLRQNAFRDKESPLFVDFFSCCISLVPARVRIADFDLTLKQILWNP
jgi:hypothetical protein